MNDTLNDKQLFFVYIYTKYLFSVLGRKIGNNFPHLPTPYFTFKTIFIIISFLPNICFQHRMYISGNSHSNFHQNLGQAQETVKNPIWMWNENVEQVAPMASYQVNMKTNNLSENGPHVGGESNQWTER